MTNNEEYIFYIKYEDRTVGYLAYLEENFYLLVSRMEDAQTAYDNGFVGIPGFRSGEIYKTPELFNFFKHRIEDKNSKNIYEELIKYDGTSRIDNFSLEEVAEFLRDKRKDTLLEAYKKQEELRMLESKKENEKTV